MKLAIIIGVSQYKADGIDDLPACEQDAKAVAGLLEHAKTLDELILLDKNESAIEIKKSLSSLVERHKAHDVDELRFYFSGHGTRDSDDFYYVASDFDQNRRETTSLRNSELDDLVKVLRPKLYIKIVDACHSGTQYIKNHDMSDEERLRKAAASAGLRDLYFWFSSREDKPSYANENLSYFTQSLLGSVLQVDGEVRYRDIMAAIADDFSNTRAHPPVFIVQAENTEKFGNITDATRAYVRSFLPSVIAGEGKKEQFDSEFSDFEIDDLNDESKSLATKLAGLSANKCFSQAELDYFMLRLANSLTEWENPVADLFKVAVDSMLDVRKIPNRRVIGAWLESDGKDLFAKPTYTSQEYTEEIYKPLPKKPRAVTGLFAIEAYLGSPEMKLVEVTRTRQLVDGFNYQTQQEAIRVDFNPLIEIADAATLYIIPLYSNAKLVIYYSYEWLKKVDWSSYSSPKCYQWNLIEVTVKNDGDASKTSTKIKSEVLEWMTSDLSKLIN